MVSPRIQQDAWSRRTDDSDEVASQRSASTYASAKEFVTPGSQDQRTPSPSQVRGSSSKWGTAFSPRSPSVLRSGDSRNSSLAPSGSRSPRQAASWRYRVPSVSRSSSSERTARRSASITRPVSLFPSVEDQKGGYWYSKLHIADDLMQDSPRGSPAPSEQQTDVGSDGMKPEPTIFESQQNLREAMEKLRTGSVLGTPSAGQAMDHENDERAVSMSRSSCQSEPACEKRTVYQHSGMQGSEPLYEEVLSQLHQLSSGLSAANETVLEKFTSMLNRIEQLERAHETRAPDIHVGGMPKRNRTTYIAPRRRAESAKSLARDVRDEIDALLNAHDDSPFVSELHAEMFAQRLRSHPYERCCTTFDFQIDVNGGSASPWNQSAALVFTEHYLKKRKLGDGDSQKVKVAFLTRVKTIKQSFRETPAQKAQKGGYVRKYNLFQRRVEALATLPALQQHLPLLQRLSIDGMSSDEEEDADDLPRQIARGVPARNPNYRVLTPVWRSKELTMFLHILDSVYLIKRRLENQRGNWPRPRVYDPSNLKMSKKTKFPKNLPENAYDKDWLKKFPNARLSVNPTAPHDFTHSPAVFQCVSLPDLFHQLCPH
ncbi:hypothetical protein NMY22_g2826 [Coprinellus aureogranulatus]|nr:hypothetical protein NMY22_g2826 [Coprinellus aureogranulatus]